MAITDFLHKKLISNKKSDADNFKNISEMIESVTDLKNGLERLTVTYSEELIDKWYKLFAEWYNQQSVKDRYRLEHVSHESFYIEIKGIQIGCCNGKDNGNNNYFNYPYWCFNKVRNDKNNDRDWVE